LLKNGQVVCITHFFCIVIKNGLKLATEIIKLGMNLLLSWNLFVIAIFVVIIAYSYIIGINKTVKTIIGTYLAILAADGLGNIFRDYLLGSENFQKLIEIANLTNTDELLINFKVIVFITAVVILTVKGAYEVHIHGKQLMGSNILVTGVFGFMSAGLIVSTILVYVSGSSLIQKVSLQSNIIELYSSSNFVRAMVNYYDFWFAIPVVIIIAWSLVFDRTQD
jgi:hypothetical protein